MLWSECAIDDRVLGQRNLSMMNVLLSSKLLPFRKDSKLILVKDLEGNDHGIIIDAIRCHSQWSIEKKEDFVRFYVEFAHWLSSATRGLIPSAIDPDRHFTQKRQLPFDEYIKLLEKLPEREIILAKLFYLGGERTFEEVLSLKIENIDFQTGQINFEKHSIRYPKHVIEDIKSYVEPRKNGFVFASKNGERLNHTVPYRAVKMAAQKLDLPPTFTIKDLVRDA